MAEKVKSIPAKEKVKIEVSGAFHGRLLGVYFNLISKYELKDLVPLLKAIEENKIDGLEKDEDKVNATSIETLMILLKGIELAFEKEGKIVEEQLDVPTS